MPFQLPDDGHVYTKHIVSRCERLIARTIWQGIAHDDLRIWLNNFSSAEQRYFAARVLDALMYRSEPQMMSMLTHLLQRTVPDLAHDHDLALPLHSPYQRLQTDADPGIRIVPVQRSGNPELASGPFVVRLIRKVLPPAKRWITVNPSKIACDTLSVIFHRRLHRYWSPVRPIHRRSSSVIFNAARSKVLLRRPCGAHPWN